MLYIYMRAATGMNSATTMLLALVPAGGHIVTTTDCYRRTRQFIQTVLPKMGITATVIDPADMKVGEPSPLHGISKHTLSTFQAQNRVLPRSTT